MLLSSILSPAGHVGWPPQPARSARVAGVLCGFPLCLEVSYPYPMPPPPFPSLPPQSSSTCRKTGPAASFHCARVLPKMPVLNLSSNPLKNSPIVSEFFPSWPCQCSSPCLPGPPCLVLGSDVLASLIYQSSPSSHCPPPPLCTLYKPCFLPRTL